MSYEVTALEYMGIPVPSHFEMIGLKCKVASEPRDDQEHLACLGEFVLSSSPQLIEIVEHTKTQHATCGTDDSLDDEQIEAFGLGIEEGFAFAVGSVAWMRYLRSETPIDIARFIRDDRAGFPTLTPKGHVRPFKRIIEGKPAAKASIPPDESIPDWIYEQTSAFMAEAEYFSVLVNEYVEGLRENHGDEFSEGVYYGVDTAIGLYVLMYEKAVVERWPERPEDTLL